jgi:hypothetical protein
MPGTTELLIQNPYSNAGQATVNGFLNNLSYAPTLEELNRAITSSRDAAQKFGTEANEEPVEPAFGTHVHEAATTVEKLFGSRK